MNHLVFEKLSRLINENTEFHFFESGKNTSSSSTYLFSNPIKKIICVSEDEIEKCILEIEKESKNYFVAGWISYEVGKKFLNKLKSNQGNKILLSFNVYTEVEEFSNTKERIPSSLNFQIEDIHSSISFEEYEKNVKSIIENIKSGNYYQINYTFPLEFKLIGDLLSFYMELSKNQTTEYSAFIRTNELSILSLSPELFFKMENGKMLMKPMKGTSNLGKESELEAEKNLAENFMIVDLIRNDLGKISKLGSVQVLNPASKDSFETLTQMTTNVESNLKDSLTLFEILEGIFPSGSVTGAPKLASMKAIESSLEKKDRGVYTGAIGFFSPNKSIFSVAIRSLEIKNEKAKIGIGSGIVFDSVPSLEWEECFLKAKFLFKSIPMQIFTSLVWKRNTFYFLDYHLMRLKKSAEFFGFGFSENEIKNRLNQLDLDFNKVYKLKITIERESHIKIETTELNSKQKKGKFSFAKEFSLETRSNSIFLYYKTSKREIYRKGFEIASNHQLMDLIFENEKAEITEGSIYNIFCKIDGIFYTPFLNAGVLDGIYRRKLLNRFPSYFKEKILYKKDILNSEEVFFCNSVRGILRGVYEKRKG
ncbi:MAG: bifunctional anthranilate synthase component I family protein/class IV aminotransferase [Leptospiraceae bacterium]|nr:bifunctional anthranilate synthase component I family protein/class IV aminotransferase [Leptospiraceae bacterium]